MNSNGTLVTNTANIGPATADRFFASSYVANVINASPVLDFGVTNFAWDGAAAEAITAGHRWGIAQQFTVTRPVNGNVRGVELMAQILGEFPASATFEPFLMKLTNAPASVMSQANGNNNPSPLGEPKIHAIGDDTLGLIGHHYQTQAILAETDPSGVWVHGFMIADNSGAGYNCNFFRMYAAVRQLNDQENIEYADTRR